MPSNWAIVESSFPTFTGKESTQEQIRQLMNYAYVLTQQLKYNLENLDSTNWNQTAKAEFQKETTRDVEESVEKMKTESGEKVEKLETGFDLLSESVERDLKELTDAVDKLQKLIDSAVTVGEDGSVTVGAEGKTVRLRGTVYVNGKLLE